MCEFPDRDDLILNVGDGTPLSGDCPCHPSGSHKGLCSFDLDYFTFKTNITQYRFTTSNTLKTTYFWGNADRGEGLPIDEKVFDWERNYYLWRLMYNVFPDLVGYTDERINDFMVAKIKNTFGLQAVSEYKSHIFGQGQMLYNHDTHIHIKLKGALDDFPKINYNFKF